MLTLEERAVLNRHLVPQGYEAAGNDFASDLWQMFVDLDELNMLEIDATFVKSSDTIYVKTTPHGETMLRDYRDDLQRRLERYKEEALF